MQPHHPYKFSGACVRYESLRGERPVCELIKSEKTNIFWEEIPKEPRAKWNDTKPFMALRVIEWVKFAKKCCSYEFHPPLGKGGFGGIFRCYRTIADLRPKLAPCGQIQPTPSYTYGTAGGENKFLAWRRSFKL